MTLATVSRLANRARLDRTLPATTEPALQDVSFVIVLPSYVEVTTALLLADSLSVALMERVGDVVIDCTDVVFMDLASVRLLDAGRQRFSHQGRKLVLRSPSRYVALVLNIFGLTEFIEQQETS